MPGPNRFAAVDAEVALALAAGDDECAGAIDCLRGIGFFFLITETPLQELADIRNLNDDTEASALATTTLQQVTNFGFLQPSLTSVQMGVAERVAQKLMEGCLAAGALNDGLVVAEAAYNNCRILLTRRRVLLDSFESDSLGLTLIDFDLPPVVIVSPPEILGHFGPSNPPSAG